MEADQILDLCLSITGTYEGGKPSYQTMASGQDGAGGSFGILQWNPGTGTLQQLVALIGTSMGWAKARSFFKCDIQAFSKMGTAEGIAFSKSHFLDTSHPVQLPLTPEARAAWMAFLSTPEAIAAERSLAESTTLAHAQRMAAKFTPADKDRTRVISFFFDLATQQGSMLSIPVSATPSPAAALAYAQTQDPVCAEQWAEVVKSDPLAATLLYYGYERARLARSQYVWGCMSRRGCIATRVGICQKRKIDFTALLD